jgi:hypothetical protein
MITAESQSCKNFIINTQHRFLSLLLCVSAVNLILVIGVTGVGFRFCPQDEICNYIYICLAGQR